MASANYKKCYNLTLKWEGGYVNHPADPGGATNKGITQRVYDGYRRRRGLEAQSVRHIEDVETAEIYRKQYWDAVRGDDLPVGLDLAVWDFAVNSGPSRAIKFLQRILGVKVDGSIGEATLAAIESRDAGQIATALCDARLAWLRGLDTYPVFGKGWSNRVSAIRGAAQRMARGSTVSAPAPQAGDTTVPRPVEPDAPERAREKLDDIASNPARRSGGFWTTITGLVTGAGTMVTGFLGGNWQAIVALGAVSIVVGIVMLLLRHKIIAAIREAKDQLT